ncbi:MAG: ABC transporter permease [Thermoanaerobaculia bacterium]
MGTLFRELRYAFRMLFKSPTSSVVAVITMGLGIGLTAGMYAVLDGIFLRGLPFEESHRLYHLERNNLERDIESMEVSQHDFEDWRAQQQSFEGLAGFTGGTVNLSDEGLPDRYTGAWISANFLDLVRVEPAIGRGFSAEHEQPGAESVILLSHHVWKKRYGGDPDIVGKTVRANAEPTTVLGVLPEGFRFPILEDVWLPLQLETAELERGEGTTLEVFGRLKDGVTLDRAAMEIATIAKRLEQEYPESNEGVGSVIKPYVDEYVGENTINLLTVMFAAVVLVLLIACFNVANLLIGRASRRSRELAIRSALGAGRWRTIAQVISEAGLISILGAAIGVVLAHFGVGALEAAVAQTDPPFWFQFTITGRVLGVTLAFAVASALIAGLVPALQATRTDVNRILQDATRGSTSFRLGRLSRVLVMLEVAISFALLVGAGLAVRSVLAANDLDLRFEGENMLTARMGLFEGDYPEEQDWVTFYERLRETLVGKAEVASAAIATVIPTDTQIGAGGHWYERPGETYENRWNMPWARWTVITPGYWDTLGVGLLAGRDFDVTDRDGAPAVAIVNEDFARKEWPDENPIGQRINVYLGEEEEAENPDAGWVEVIGMAPNLRFADFDNDDDQQGIYVPLAQNPVRFAWVVTRTRADPLGFADPLRRTVLEIDPDLPLYFVRSMDQVLEQTLFMPNLLWILFAIFGGSAVVLTCVGLYGVMAFGVTQRTQEMGVRMAFGARARDVLGMVLKQGLVQTAIGLLIGLVLAIGMAIFMSTFLYQVKPWDPVTFGGIPVLLLVVATLACLIPARRAATVDPIQALHYE